MRASNLEGFASTQPGNLCYVGRQYQKSLPPAGPTCGEFPKGYLEFLKEAQNGIKEAFSDYKRESGKGFDKIEQEIRSKFKNKTLARIVDEYNYSTYTFLR